jgi:flagellar assembly protein FliH
VRKTGEDPEDPESRIRHAEEEARAEGLARGLAEGQERARVEAEERLRALAASIEELAGYRLRLVREAERDLLELAVRIAEKVVRDTIARDGETVVRALRAALEELPRGEPCTVRCHPADEGALSGFLAGSGAGPAACTLRADPALTPGGCVVESAAGDIDVRIETQLRVLEHELLARA